MKNDPNFWPNKYDYYPPDNIRKKHLAYDDLEAEEYEELLQTRKRSLWDAISYHIQRSFALCFLIGGALTVFLLWVSCRVIWG